MNTEVKMAYQPTKPNRRMRRWALRKTTVMPVQVIRENKVTKHADGTQTIENVAVAYLHPRKGWIGNKKAVARAGYKYNKRRTIG